MNPASTTLSLEEVIALTVDALRAGKTLLYPTDTIWGIGCDARQISAVERLYAIKERDHTKSMLILCTPEMISLPTAEVTTTAPLASAPAESVTSASRPTTYIVPATFWQPHLGDLLAPNLPAANGSLGIRIPRHTFCQEVIRRLGAPLVSTSANLSGHPAPRCYAEIEEALRQRVDYCVPPLPELLSEETRGSRIVKLNADGTTTLLRP